MGHGRAPTVTDSNAVASDSEHQPEAGASNSSDGSTGTHANLETDDDSNNVTEGVTDDDSNSMVGSRVATLTGLRRLCGECGAS